MVGPWRCRTRGSRSLVRAAVGLTVRARPAHVSHARRLAGHGGTGATAPRVVADAVLRIPGEGMPHHNFPSDKGALLVGVGVGVQRSGAWPCLAEPCSRSMCMRCVHLMRAGELLVRVQVSFPTTLSSTQASGFRDLFAHNPALAARR